MNNADGYYRYDGWQIIEEGFQKDQAARGEAVFSLSNGYIGLRGSLEEGHPVFEPGTYVNGFYESGPYHYPEPAFGYAPDWQTILNVADAKTITLSVDGAPFSLLTGRLHSYRRSLDLKNGQLIREIDWESAKGIRVVLCIRRLVSLVHPHLAAMSFSVQADKPVRLAFRSELRGDVENRIAGEDPRVGSLGGSGLLSVDQVHSGPPFAYLLQRTTRSDLTLLCGMEHRFSGSENTETSIVGQPQRLSANFATDVRPDVEVRLEKFFCYFTSREMPKNKLVPAAQQSLEKAANRGFETLLAEQSENLRRFWRVCDVQIEGADHLQQALRFNIFQLYQSAPRIAGVSIPAKGLSGEGYGGHTFWDTETYMLPFFALTHPTIARNLLVYRIGQLGAARQNAQLLSLRGALFPWRTIAGTELSPYFPAGSAQYHINAGIVYALEKYTALTGDNGLLWEGGAELLFETARMWLSLGQFSEDAVFTISKVTGPDEYTALVDNNLYTNVMAAGHLSFAARTAVDMKHSQPHIYRDLTEKIALSPDEIMAWAQAAEAMYLPEQSESGIYPQNDGFLQQAVWKLADDRKPLLLHVHPLALYRHQVLKQPDVVLALFLQNRCFSMAEKKRNFDYYDPLTTGDSSLAPGIQSVVASELGYRSLAYRYFSSAALLDLEDTQSNTRDGLHMAAMAGSWLALVFGFAGLRENGGFSFRPRLPLEIDRLSFLIRRGENLLQVELNHTDITYTLEEGSAMTFRHEQQDIALRAATPITLSLQPVLQAVILDLDGVITDTAELHFQAWKVLAEELDIPFDRLVNDRLRGVSRRDSLEILLESHQRPFSESEKQMLMKKKNSHYRRLIGQIQPNDLLPGIRKLLLDCRDRGIKTAVASVSRNAHDVIQKLGIESLLDLVVDPIQVRVHKPDPEIFFLAADTLGIPYQNCIGIEDAQAGLEAIKSAGMIAVGIGHSLQGADLQLQETTKLTLQLLEGLISSRSEPPSVAPPSDWVKAKQLNRL